MKGLSGLLDSRAADLRQNRWGVSVGLLALLAAFAAIGTVFARGILHQLGGEPAYAREVVQRIAEGDMSQPVRVAAGDATGLLAAMAQMQARLVDVVSHVRQNSDGLATASSQIAQGNLDLSGRTEEQASGLQATAAAMDELSATVSQNAGEQGRGFAVVATEVRSLAGRSADAAREIKGLINASVERVAQGTTRVDQAGV